LETARKLPDAAAALRPKNGKPVDVTNGAPLDNWDVDHIMSRSEIANSERYRERFRRLTPAQREAILTEVPENYLPMSKEANSSKGAVG
jgi:hypothetical protein